jgi:uncharacterized protein (DUF1330 family)
VDSYVSEIEPRLTPHRPARPETVADTLIEACRDLEQETLARLARISPEALHWQPHPDANSVGVTVWHIARWLDVLGTRAFSGGPAHADRWHTSGWVERTGYEPDGVGWGGLGTLTGYAPAEMRAVPRLDGDQLGAYLSESTAALVETLDGLRDHLHVGGPPSPYQVISSTLQGSFGHVGEIDALVSLRARLSADTTVTKAYWINTFRSISDPAKLAAYVDLAGPAMLAGGGRFLARGAPAAAFESGVLERTTLIEFDTVEQAVAAYHGEGYQRALTALGDGAERDIRIIESMP